MMRWQWHQLDHMQIICTSLQTDKDTSTSPLIFMSDELLASLSVWSEVHKWASVRGCQ